MKTVMLLALLFLTAGIFAMSVSVVSAAHSTLDNVAPVTMLSAPTGGETWVTGETNAITWTATDTNFATNPIRLEYSLNGGSSYTAISAATANNSSYNWLIPAIASTDARVRITATDSFGISGQSTSPANLTFAGGYNVSVGSDSIPGAIIYANGSATGYTTPHTFISPRGTNVTYTVTKTDYVWKLATGSESNVITNLTGSKNIVFEGTFTRVDPVNPGFIYTGDPNIPITGVASTVADLNVPLPSLSLVGAIVMVFTGDTPSDLTVTVPDGTWYVVAYYENAWHQSNPYPANGHQDVLLANIPFSAKSDIPVIIDDVDGTLPVELNLFTAYATQNNSIQLDWVTQSETGVSGYYIYRSISDNLYSADVVSPLIPAQNTSTEQSYRYTDYEVTPGIWYYWLQNIDIDQQMAFHGSISVTLTDNDGNNGAPVTPRLTSLNSIFPNPFNPVTTIAFGLARSEQVTLEIYNIKGSKVRTVVAGNLSGGTYRRIWNGTDDNGGALSSGIYFLRMTAGKYSSTAKLVLLK